MMSRFFIPPTVLGGQRVALTADHAHQIAHVLRLHPGDTIVVLDNTGLEYDVTLTAVRRDRVEGTITAKRPALGEPRTQLTLFQSLLARDKFELVLQKCTEVGVCRFVPIVTERTLVRSAALDQHKLARWQRILTEAAEQSERGRIPLLDPPIRLEEALASLAHFDRSLIAVPHAGSSITEVLHAPAETYPREYGSKSKIRNPQCEIRNSNVALLIGPEGGFTDQEVHLACDHGAVPISLGPRILRTETAAIVASSLILHHLGDPQQ